MMQRRDVILQKIADAEMQYEKENRYVKASCEEYGSELAGDIFDKIHSITARINHLKELLAMPEVNMSQGVLKTRLADIKVDISRIENDIVDLEKQKATLLIKKQNKETLFDLIKELISISSS